MASSVTVIKTVDDRREFSCRKENPKSRSEDRAAFQNEAEESDESEDETAGERTRKDESGKNARWHEGRCENW